MDFRKSAIGIGLAVAAVLVACAPAGGPATLGSSSEGQTQFVGKKRVVTSYPAADVNSMSALIPGAAGRAVAPTAHAGLAILNEKGELSPELAEAVPSIENGLWKVFPDGRMETTWKLKSSAKWHDGQPITTADLLFTAKIEQDKELALGSSYKEMYNSGIVESLDAIDASTFSIRWKRPYIDAALVFGVSDRLAPKHVLEEPYLADKGTLLGNPYWTDEYIGAGPFKLKEYVRGSHALFVRFDDYVLGRPKLDEIELRFISNNNTLVASLLSGAVDTNLVGSQSLSPDQADQLRQQWKDGTVAVSPIVASTVAIFPQLQDPALRITLNTDFRRAILYAINRQEMLDEIMLGQGGIPHSIVAPHLPEYSGIQDAVVRYDYDPRRAAQLLEQVGYRKGPSGIYQDAAGEALAFDIWSSAQNTERATVVVADFLKSLGLDVKPFIIPPQQISDPGYLGQFPAFRATTPSAKNYGDVRAPFHSSLIPTQENKFVGSNTGRYRNPDLDAALDRLANTIALSDRVQALSDAVRIETNQAVWMGLYFLTYNTAVSKRLINRTADNSLVPWGAFAYQWDVTS